MTSPLHPSIRLAAALTLLITACSRAPVAVLDLPVSKGDWTDYDQSLEIIRQRQTPEERTEFARAMQELRYEAMIGGCQPGPETNGAVRAKIAGFTVRDVLVLGQTIKTDRMRAEEKALIRSISMNSRRRARPGDTESATYLASLHADQGRQLAKLRAEIEAMERRLDELSPPRQKGPVVVPTKELDEPPVPLKT